MLGRRTAVWLSFGVALGTSACAADPPPRPIPVYLPVVRSPWLAPQPAPARPAPSTSAPSTPSTPSTAGPAEP